MAWHPATGGNCKCTCRFFGDDARGAYRQFHKFKKVDYRLAAQASLIGVIGALVGAWLLVQAAPLFLEKLIGILSLALLLLSVIKKRIQFHWKIALKVKHFFGYGLFLLAGLLGGFFGGQSILATYIFSIFFDKTASQSIGTRKVNGLIVSSAALFIYGFHQLINWRYSLFLISGTLIGSTSGSRYALKKGDAWMEKVFNVFIVLLCLKFLF